MRTNSIIPNTEVKLKRMSAYKVKPDLDDPLPQDREKSVAEPTAAQMTLWPSLEEPKSESETAENLTAKHGSDANLFGETLLALATVRGLGFRTLVKIAEVFDNRLERIWHCSPDEILSKLQSSKNPSLEKLLEQITTERESLIQQGVERFKHLSAQNIKIIPAWNLPPSLQDISDGPRWLFVQGDYHLLYYKPAVAVVGTRTPTQQGVQAAAVVARHIAAYPISLVSGLAEGIDETAHRYSLNGDTKNIAFLGHGINVVFPSSTQWIREKIIENDGAIVTEYLPDESYRKEYFVARNRLQAAVSDLVIPVEGNSKGGTAHTIRFAKQYGRPLLGVKWRGVNGILPELEKDGAPIIDIFSRSGKVQFDRTIRALSEQFGRATNATSVARRKLFDEIRERDWRTSDIESLIEALQTFLKEEGNVEGS
jgi:DNA processing protein